MNSHKMPRLITIPISHYCEKARWALERAEIKYKEEQHLQGFHIPHVYRAGKLDTAPVLVTSEGVFNDSTTILQWIDSKTPAHLKLYSEDLKLKKEVEAFEDTLDEEFGVAGRLWMYTFMLDELPLIMKYSKLHKVPRYEKFLMPFVFPKMKKLIAKAMKVRPDSRKKTYAKIEKTLNDIEKQLSDGRPFLLGERFTAADLTFASLAAAILLPENYGVILPKPEECPSEMRDQILKWRAHPAGQFALKLYTKYRHFT